VPVSPGDSASAPQTTVDALGELKRQHKAFVSARLVLVALFAALWLLLFAIGYAMPTGFMAVLIVEMVALRGFMSLVGRASTSRTLQHTHYALLLVELGCHTAMVYFLGGLSWLGPIAYVYALMYAAVFLTWRQAALFTSAVGVAYLIVVLLDGTGTIPHHWYLPQGPDRYRDMEFLVTTSVAFVGVLATITFWMVFIGNELRREKEIALKANANLVSAQSELRHLNEELEQKVALRTEALVWRAEHDPLTGLLNRGTVTRRLQELLTLERRGGRPMAVIVADADNFKVCNDTAGHAYGDEVLRVIAECLEGSGRESDVAGRLGGDEFLIVLPDTGERGAQRFCRRLLKRMQDVRSGWTLPGPSLPTMSLGVALFPDQGSDIDELVRVADHAMYRAKADGGDGVAFGGAESSFPRPVSPARRRDVRARG